LRVDRQGVRGKGHGLRVEGSGLQRFGFKDKGVGVRAYNSGCGVHDPGFRV